jgi:hypothetical protein
MCCRRIGGFVALAFALGAFTVAAYTPAGATSASPALSGPVKSAALATVLKTAWTAVAGATDQIHTMLAMDQPLVARAVSSTSRRVGVSFPRRQADGPDRPARGDDLEMARSPSPHVAVHSAAFPALATLEAETMSLPTGASLINDSNASGAKAMKLTTNGTTTASISLPSQVTSLTITARGDQCAGAPTLSASVDGRPIIGATSITATADTGVSAATNLATGSHSVSITGGNLGNVASGNSGKVKCSRILYLDVTTFSGPASNPAPAVSLSTSPMTITRGASSTLTWTSTNATSCTASGAWSGSKATAGSEPVSPTTTSTYTLTCSGADGSASASTTATMTVGIVLPTPPQAYTIPAGAVSVSTASQLATEVSKATAEDIVLEDGTYDNTAYLQFGTGHRLWARHLGQAILHFGLVPGGNFGSGGQEFHGLTFDVTDPSRTFQSSIINTWGAAGVNVKIMDCVFKGSKAIAIGVNGYNPTGLVMQRDQFFNFTDEGARLSNNSAVGYGGSTPHITTLTDLYIDGVSRATPGASNGTAEAGLWVGHPVDNGVHRIQVLNVSISGIETANNSWDTTFSDLTINMGGANQASGVGVYMEHYTYHDTFTDFNITGVKAGFNAEWDYGTAGNAGAHFTTIDGGTIDAAGSSLPGNQVGVYLDQGTESTTVTNVTFNNQNTAGIDAYNTTGTNTFSNNTANLAPGAVPISTAHL